MESVRDDGPKASENSGTREADPAEPTGLGSALSIDTAKVRSHVDEVVRSTVEQTLNEMLDAEADRVAGAARYERTPDRRDTRAGSYERRLQTKAGEVKLTVPRLRKLPLETAIIERYKRRESSVEEALIEMYLAGVSMRRIEDITPSIQRGPVGLARERQHGQRAGPEGLRPDRGVAEPEDRGRARVRLPRRAVAQAELGRRGQERGGAGGDRGRSRGLPRGAGRGRGDEGGRRELAFVPAAPQGARARGRAAGGQRQVPGAGRVAG